MQGLNHDDFPIIFCAVFRIHMDPKPEQPPAALTPVLCLPHFTGIYPAGFGCCIVRQFVKVCPAHQRMLVVHQNVFPRRLFPIFAVSITFPTCQGAGLGFGGGHSPRSEGECGPVTFTDARLTRPAHFPEQTCESHPGSHRRHCDGYGVSRLLAKLIS